MRFKSILIFALLCAGAWGAWHLVYPSGTWRYKIIVTVNTPEGLKKGSAVREVHAYRVPQILPEQHSAEIDLTYGEAVVVDLGSRGVLFALTKEKGWGARYSKMLPFLVFSEEKGSLSANSIRRFRTLKAGPAEVAPEWYPDFAYFKNLNDRKTAIKVAATNFAEAFGEGVTLKSITLEMTTEPITQGIVDKYLPWLEPWRTERAKLPLYTVANPKDWEGAQDPEFARAVVTGLITRN